MMYNEKKTTSNSFRIKMSDYHIHRSSLDGQSCVEPSCTSPARHRCKHCHKAYCDMCVRVHKRYVLQEMSDIAKQVYIFNL